MPDYVKRGLVVSGAFFLIAYLCQPSSFKVSNTPIVPVKVENVQGVVAVPTPELPEEEVAQPVLKRTETGHVEKSKLGGKIVDKIRAAFPEDPDTAVAVAMCESSLDPSRIGDKHLPKPSYGLFQVSRIYHNYSEEYLLNEDNNLEVARKIYDRAGGWRPWTCYKTGQYKNNI